MRKKTSDNFSKIDLRLALGGAQTVVYYGRLDLRHLKSVSESSSSNMPMFFLCKELTQFDRNNFRHGIDYIVVRTKSTNRIDKFVQYLSVSLILLGCYLMIQVTN